jgi:hypothetical protein
MLSGFVLFALFNYLPHYQFNACRAAAEIENKTLKTQSHEKDTLHTTICSSCFVWAN